MNFKHFCLFFINAYLFVCDCKYYMWGIYNFPNSAYLKEITKNNLNLKSDLWLGLTFVVTLSTLELIKMKIFYIYCLKYDFRTIKLN